MWLAILICAAFFATGCSTGKKKVNDGEVHYLLGLSYLKEQNPTLALREFLLAQEFHPRDAEIQAALGQAYQLKKAYPQAEGHYLRALKLSKDDPKHQNNLAALYLDMQRWEDAVIYFRRASSNLLFTAPELALSGMGYAYFNLGKYPEAAASFRDALAFEPRYPQARLGLGEVFFARDEIEPAIAEFRQALVVAPDYAMAHYKLGLTYLKVREIGKARDSFRQVVRLVPDSDIGQLAANYLNLLK
jgi:Tfp pilus assembly protein PilF